MTQRITQAKLQRFQLALSEVIKCVHDARVRYPTCGHLRPKRLAGFSRFLHDLTALPHTSDFSKFEVQLKRRLVRTNHRVFGMRFEGAVPGYSLREQLPTVYAGVLLKYGEEARELLRSLADVDLSANHQPLKSVRELA